MAEVGGIFGIGCVQHSGYSALDQDEGLGSLDALLTTYSMGSMPGVAEYGRRSTPVERVRVVYGPAPAVLAAEQCPSGSSELTSSAGLACCGHGDLTARVSPPLLQPIIFSDLITAACNRHAGTFPKYSTFEIHRK